MKHIFLFILAITCLALASSLVRLTHAPAEMALFWRLLGASVCLIPFAFHARRNFQWKSFQSQIPLLFVCGFFFFTHLWTYFFAAHNTSIANCMIIFSINPLFTAVGALIFFKEKIRRRLILAYLLALIGLWVLIKDQISLTQGFRSGDLVSLVSAFLISGYLITSKMLRQKIASTIFTSSLYFITSLYFLAWGTYQGVDFINYPASTWYAIAGLILIPTLLGHNLFSYLLGHMNINILSCGKLLEPIVASVAAYFLFAESIYESTALAFLLTSSAVVLLFLPQKTKDT